MELRYEITGSTGEIYVMTMRAADGRILLNCTCKAGQMGTLCKHRLMLVEGAEQPIVSSSHGLDHAKAMVSGSSLLQAVENIRALEREADRLTRQLSKAKKALAREMAG